jgi:hypothetical protein
MPVRRLVLRTVAGTAVASLLILFIVAFAGWPIQIGDDWLWYRNGIDRLAAGQPLYKAEWLAGPYNYVSDENFYQFNQVPWLLPIVAPVSILPDPIDRFTWLAAMDAALTVAFALSFGNRAGRRWPVLLTLVLWAPTLMCIVWGNIENLVVLGVALWFLGQRRGSRGMETAGMVLASLKVVPAIPLILLSLKSRRIAPVVAAGTIVALMTVPAVLLRGLDVIPSFLMATVNIAPLDIPQNLSPAIWMGIPLSLVRSGALLAMITAILIRRDWLATALAELTTCGLVTNLYADWLLPCVLPAIARSRETESGPPSISVGRPRVIARASSLAARQGPVR